MNMNIRYSKWSVVSFAFKRGAFRYWNCKCDCGESGTVREYDLLSGKSKGCKRCATIKMFTSCITHGETRDRKTTPEFRSYHHMRQRCLNPNRPDFRHYGARGIKICDGWLESFENFLQDMGRCPTGFTLERKDNELGYSKENCCWASRSAQANNTRVVTRVSHEGKTHTVTEWSKLIGISRTALWSRIKRGWDISKALTWNV